ncbi:helix-turn-helix domain-containing protein [Methylobacterium iners]
MENDRLRAENSRLNAILAPAYSFPRRWDLTGQQAQVLALLYSQGGCLSYARIAAAMTKGTGDRSTRHISVVIRRIREKTESFGVEIENYQSVGYGLSVEGRAVVKAALGARA